MIESIQERDHPFPIQSSKFGHLLGRELVLVVGRDVMFDLVGASPLERAERASGPRLVFLLQVSLQLLDALELPHAVFAHELLHAVEHVCGE